MVKDNKKNLCIELHKIGAVKFGLFTLKSGLKSPIYLDLRLLVSYPKTLGLVAKEFDALAKKNKLKFDRVAGVPYAALPIATAFSLEANVPMIYPRKERKDYGTGQGIEGVFKKGETILLCDDLITTAESKFEAIEVLKGAGLVVKDVIVLVDRGQGGKEQLAERGYKLHSVLAVGELLEELHKAGKLSGEEYKSAAEYFKNPQKWQEGEEGK
ncbi:MAG: orotate phosphoribosyltransferase [Candidatus Diapherotrites archaeon]